MRSALQELMGEHDANVLISCVAIYPGFDEGAPVPPLY